MTIPAAWCEVHQADAHTCACPEGAYEARHSGCATVGGVCIAHTKPATVPYEPESVGDIEFVPEDLTQSDLEILASDLNEVLCGDEYGFDLHDHTVKKALPAFIAELRKHAVGPTRANGCPEAKTGRK